MTQELGMECLLPYMWTLLQLTVVLTDYTITTVPIATQPKISQDKTGQLKKLVYSYSFTGRENAECSGIRGNIRRHCKWS